MSALPILLLDYENQSLGCNGFLLQLAGFAVTEVGSPAEALNWATYHQQSSQPFALLAAANLPEAEIVKLIRLLQRAKVSLPLLLVSRECPLETGRVCETSALGEAVYFCRPELIAPAVRHLIDTTTTPERCGAPDIKQTKFNMSTS